MFKRCRRDSQHMGGFVASATDGRVAFDRGAFTGAIGDSVTVIPIVVALATLTDVSLPHVLAGFGAFQVVWGVVYGLPLSVEPMKALAALAIAGSLTYAELSLAGVALGIVLLVVGLSGTLGAVERWIGGPVIRGVQFAVALVLFETGLDLVLATPRVGAAGVGLVGIAVMAGRRSAAGLVVVATSLAVAVSTTGLPTPTLPGLPPRPAFTAAATTPAVRGVLAQLAMTVGNAALATSLLLTDRFDAAVTPDALATSMGVTNLLAVPLGGIPMCHGCDGVSGKYAFGARTGGANVVVGVGYLAAALVATTALVAAIPLAMIGAVLGVVALSLARSVRASERPLFSVAVGGLGVFTNLGLAFLLGVFTHLVWTRYVHPRTGDPA